MIPSGFQGGGEMSFEQRNLLIVWNESKHIGVNIVDEQHRGIVSIINSLHYSLSLRDAESFLRPTAEMIMGYTQIHFKTEIGLLQDSGYPWLREHMDQHDQLIADADRIFADCLKEGGDPTKFLNFLKDWWLVHIAREDMTYSAHLLKYLRSPRRVITKLS